MKDIYCLPQIVSPEELAASNAFMAAVDDFHSVHNNRVVDQVPGYMYDAPVTASSRTELRLRGGGCREVRIFDHEVTGAQVIIRDVDALGHRTRDERYSNQEWNFPTLGAASQYDRRLRWYDQATGQEQVIDNLEAIDDLRRLLGLPTIERSKSASLWRLAGLALKNATARLFGQTA